MITKTTRAEVFNGKEQINAFAGFNRLIRGQEPFVNRNTEREQIPSTRLVGFSAGRIFR